MSAFNRMHIHCIWTVSCSRLQKLCTICISLAVYSCAVVKLALQHYIDINGITFFLDNAFNCTVPLCLLESPNYVLSLGHVWSSQYKLLMRWTVHYAKPLCNYAGQWYEAGANKYPIKIISLYFRYICIIFLKTTPPLNICLFCQLCVDKHHCFKDTASFGYRCKVLTLMPQGLVPVIISQLQLDV